MSQQDRALRRLEEILASDLDNIARNLILYTDQGIEAFGCYFIAKTSSGIEVSKHGVFRHVFSNMRSALSWCVADKYNQIGLSTDIERLDRQIWNMRSDIDVRAQTSRRVRDAARRETIELKIDIKKARLKLLDQRLDKCINLAKYWQIRGFNNEIARTRRPAPNRTSRPGHRNTSRPAH